MSLFGQILFGSSVLAFCAVSHVAIVVYSLPAYSRVARAIGEQRPLLRTATLLWLAILIVVLAHTVQIWTWAFFFYMAQAFETFETSFYFATVTYTTLGYGDLVLDERLRVFATFGSITGLLTFGISTAFLMAIIMRILPEAALKAARRDLDADDR